ncbi:MAG: hypothetical protein WCA30_05915, partial [Dermatophilaceae bacterium]
QCDVPALSTTAALRADPTALAAAVAAVDEAVGATGGRLVLVAAEGPESLAALTEDRPRLLADVTVREDPRLLLTRPDSLVPLRIALWSAAANA